MAQVDRNCLKKLKIFRKKFDLMDEKKRHQILQRFYFLIDNCEGQLPNLQDIFHTGEMDWLVGSRDKEGQTLLHLAVIEGNKKMTEFLLRNGSDPNAANESGLMTPLHIICKLKRSEKPTTFLKIFFEINDELHQTVQVDARDKLGWTPLQLALQRGDKTLVELLLRRGASPNVRTKRGFTNLHIICRSLNDDNAGKFLKILFKISDENHRKLNVDARDNSGRSPLHYAMARNYKIATESLLRRGANPSLTLKDGSTPLQMIFNNQTNKDDEKATFMTFFFDINDELHQTINVDFLDSQGRSMLHYAAERRLKKMTESLLRRGADQNLSDKDGYTPLHMICNCRDNHTETTTFLEFFFDLNDKIHQLVNVDALNESNESPLLLALKNKNIQVAEVLLRRGANPKLVNEGGSQPLHLVINIGDDLKVATFLKMFCKINKNNQVQIDARDEKDQTPLCMALNFGLTMTAEVLLRNGANPNLAAEKGLTALHLICQSNCIDNFVERFFKICDEKHRKVQIDARDESGRTPLLIALFRGRKNVVELLLKNGANPNLVDENGWTPLHMMCECKTDEEPRMTTMQIFFDVCDKIHRSVEVNTLDKFGETPLHSSLKHKNMNMTELLLKKGAGPNVPNKDGSTALHLICQSNGDDDFVETFFKICDEKHQTVQIDARDQLGRTPLQFAVANPLPDVVDMLLDRGADLSSFVFPSESLFVQCFEELVERACTLEGVSRLLVVVERLEKRGYELDLRNALTIVKTFVECGLFEKSRDLEFWCSNEELISEAEGLMIKPRLSLYDWIWMRPKKAEKLLTYVDYLDLARSKKLKKLSYHSRRICTAQLCEILSRKFRRRWTMEFFLVLTHYQLPILCCEKIIDLLKNEDLLGICLAAEIVVKEEI